MDHNELAKHFDGQMKDLRTEMSARFDRVEDKLDNAMERLSKAETSISWLRGMVKTALSLCIVAASAVATFIINHFTRS